MKWMTNSMSTLLLANATDGKMQDERVDGTKKRFKLLRAEQIPLTTFLLATSRCIYMQQTSPSRAVQWSPKATGCFSGLTWIVFWIILAMYITLILNVSFSIFISCSTPISKFRNSQLVKYMRTGPSCPHRPGITTVFSA